ncbi:MULTISPECIES: IclR family transcriptional regulator [Ramlibacter]|uniref:Helix-turn-helix domain-containing protein n=1 Tax=Ramlibacter pinisoli TaxID=2682844 RepID=A0A6N8J0H9_9BURK|nr:MULTISPECIES: IclR family transcriptional regulator [Ramlibacter]MBA2961828.1 IclR family transcriptional regulator [Ramlibacter sp. CGMCC 1.13660]MVQ31770.1 helix-turn-helix domain-containing protein [Ramlibacter pinisoli]
MPRSAAAKPADRRQRVQSAEMGMAILKALADLGGAASLTSLANSVEESTAKVHRYLASLAQEGLVAQDAATQHYYLGREAIRIGLAALRQCDPVRMGEGALVRLREQLQVTCFIAVMGNKGPTVLRMEEPALPVTVNMRPGSVLPLLWSATGQAFLGFSDEAAVLRQAEEEFAAAPAEQRALLAGARPIERLRRQVRDQGCAIVNDTMLKGISAVSAPIFDATGKVSAMLTALGASSGFDARPGGRICPEVIREAQAISIASGHEPDRRAAA